MKITVVSFLAILILIYSCGTPKKTISINISNRNIELGDSVTLTWDISERKIEKISLEGINDDIKRSGTITVKPDTTTNYRFIIEKKKQKPIRKTFKVNVLVPKITYFKGPAKAVSDEQFFEVNWNTDNAKRVRIENYKDKLPLQGSLRMRLDSTTELNLIAENSFGNSDSKQITIDVKVIEKLNAPEEIYIGDSVYVSWRFKHTKSVQIEGIEATFNAIDSVKVAPEATTRYLFRIQNSNGTERTTDATIKVLPPAILFFDAPKTVGVGTEATLSWSVRGAKEITIEDMDGVFEAKGRVKVKPEHSKTYKLIAKRDGFQTSKMVRVEVVRNRKYVETVKNASSVERMDMEIFDVDYSDYPNSIKAKVLAVDSKGGFVSGLAAKKTSTYFKSLEENIGGKPHAITGFTVAEMHNNKLAKPYDFALALDYTASLNLIIDSLEKGARNFIEKKTDDDLISVVKFNDTIMKVVDLSADKKALITKSQFDGKISYNGSTAFYAGADLAISTLDSAENNKTVVLFTDGQESASFVYRLQRAVTAEQLIQNAHKKNTKLHIIAYGDEVNVKLLKRIAQLTGGNCYITNRPEDIVRIFNELPFIFRNYYEITYKPFKEEGVRKLNLTYNNFQSAKELTSTEFLIGDKFSVKAEEFLPNTYWEEYCDKNFEAVTPPQATAFFSFDKSDLEDVYKSNLLKYVDYLKENKGTKAVVIGHTDLKGSQIYCIDLSQRRAKMVKNFLVENGIENSRIEVVGRGQNNPIWKSEEYDWQARENRRIEILLLSPRTVK